MDFCPKIYVFFPLCKGEIQKALAETAGVPVDALKVKVKVKVTYERTAHHQEREGKDWLRYS